MKGKPSMGVRNGVGSYPVKVSRPAPVRGKKKNVDVFHMTRGKKGRI